MSTIILYMGMILKMSKPVELGWHTATDVMLWLVILLLVPVVLYFLSRKSSNGLDKEIFEERNTEFGAYNIRKNLPRNLGIGFLVGFVLLSFVLLQLGFTSTKESKPVAKKVVKKREIIIEKKEEVVEKKEEKKDEPERESRPKEEAVVKKVEPDPVELPDTTNLHKIDTNKTNTNFGVAENKGKSGGDGTGEDSLTGGGGTGKVEPPRVYYPDELSVQPGYPGGTAALQSYLSIKLNSLKSPAKYRISNQTYTVQVSFKIDKEGNVVGASLSKKYQSELSKTDIDLIIKTMNAMPKWNPGIYMEKPVISMRTLPITLNP